MTEDERDPQEMVEARQPPWKLDLAYFTRPDRCPLMVRQRARRAFELFLFLAHRWMASEGQTIAPSHAEMCAACGLDASNPSSAPAMSRLLRLLRESTA